MESEMETAGTKAVLISFGESRRVINVPLTDSAQSTVSEHDFLLNAFLSEFRDLLPDDVSAYTLTLQVKDETWGGVFVDYKHESVMDKAVSKLVAIPRMVSVCVL